MIRILCNRCGADITTGKAFGEVMVKLHESPDFDTPFKWVAGENDDEHYCEECVKEIAQFVHTPPKTEQGTESPPPRERICREAGQNRKPDRLRENSGTAERRMGQCQNRG